MNVVSWTAFFVFTIFMHCHDGTCLQNFALRKPATQSTTLNYNNFDWTADKAVDGNTTGVNPDNTRTCSSTYSPLSTKTWEVDIGFLIIVKTITVYERTDGTDQLSGFKVFIGNTTNSWTGNQPLNEVQPVINPHTFRVNDSLARFVSVTRPNSYIMTICEVIVEGECQKGRFGNVCNETCGNCLYGNASCNSSTGQCTEGCQQGWRGGSCKESCNIGTYGFGCNGTCGMCFNGNSSCSTTDGRCMLGCTAGWQGENCTQGCKIGTYGFGCNETCGMCLNGNISCSTTDGRCTRGCTAGWQGEKCTQGCNIGTYGYGCNGTCGMCLNGNISCSTTDGRCTLGCTTGYQGENCKQGCKIGTYGFGCNETCGMCLNGNNSCSTTDGRCTRGCTAGWQGETCKQECEQGKYWYGCNETCGKCFSGNESCSRIDGLCNDGCEAGWQGETCKQECSRGTYGEGCNESCGLCFRGNDSCLTTNGHCQFGCEAGWWGDTCKQVCEQGIYGYGCNETCGKCFNGNNSCSIVDGQCNIGCEAGWQGRTCKQGCNIGTYGYGCNGTCGMCLNGNSSCSTTDGKCMFGCRAGWQGETCTQVCSRGKYGDGCNETCGMCFRGNDSCLTTNGHCQFGCEAGWWGDTCKQECEQGTYSYGCNETCGMCYSGNISCSIIDGQCNIGCEAGWQGGTCKQEIRMQPTSAEIGIIIIAVVVPVAIVVILLIIVVIILRVKRTRSNLSKEVPTMPNKGENVFHQAIPEKESSDRKTQEIEDTTLNKGNIYENSEKKTRLMVPVLSFWGHVMNLKATKEEVELEFQEFSRGLTKKHEDALANPSKNRYKSIYPYDFNRVVLKRDSVHDSEYENDSDYINASHIKGFEDRKSYIAAQGPINTTVGDFWWMVWQERIECIIMLTNLSEMGKVKCIQYWPDKEDQTYGDVTVKSLGSESFADCIKRDLQITVNGKSRNVTQFHYTAWPDKDVPDTAWSLVEFWKTVRKHRAYGNGPMTVHCSAGVGRTGTFIALDIIYDEACDTGHVAVIKCVENLRDQRVNMVQTVNQFIFLHDAVAEALGLGTMPVYKKQFPYVLRHLVEKDEGSGVTRMQRQYNMLRKLNLEQEESKMSVYSNADVFESEIIRLPNLSGRDAYFAVKHVDDETLLATIAKRNIKWLIMVDGNRRKDGLVSIGVNQSKTVAGLDITCKEKEDLGAFERRQFSIASHGRNEPQKLTMFMLKSWEESNEVPPDSHSVLSLLEDFSQHHPSPSELNPVLIYSRWELNRCSLIYILLNEKDRIRRDGEIHVLRTVAEMLGRSRELLPTFEQYDLIYKCLPTDDLQDSTYENTAGIMKEIL
ncbi:hypothetical protein ACJMK2_032767 [Sinanodonta woodiana]|uniref:protein-tyrosine-phosphatase n=1 Tax=Sinanodonta woodiana TaxID=1069815 RepID=A0ABD3X4X3_SINWO